jgi:energy-coupling factor transporter ATP-binding protein EcfA2
MKLRDSAIAGVLACSAPITVWYSTQVGECQARFLPEQEAIQTIARKPPSFGLMVLLGLAQGGAALRFAYLLLRDEEETQFVDEEKPAAIAGNSQPILPPNQSVPVSFPASATTDDPVAVGVGAGGHDAVEPTPMQSMAMVATTPMSILDSPEYRWIQTLLEYPSILIYGGQGSGKSTLLRYLIRLRYGRGHQIKILDPHYKAGDWKGLEVFGKGMNYREIDLEIKKILRLIKSRYSQFSEIENIAFPPITIVCEEMIAWIDEVSAAGEFFRASLSDIRKVGVHVVFVSHNRTLTSLGGSSGLAKTRDSALLELELETKVSEETGKASPTFRGKLKLPSTDRKIEQEVDVPQLSNSDIAISETEKHRHLLSLQGQNFFAEMQECLEETEAHGSEKIASGETGEKSAKPFSGNGDSNCDGELSGTSEEDETTEKALYSAISNFQENGKGKVEVIEILWGVSSGRRYQRASARFDALIEKFGNNNSDNKE